MAAGAMSMSAATVAAGATRAVVVDRHGGHNDNRRNDKHRNLLAADAADGSRFNHHNDRHHNERHHDRHDDDSYCYWGGRQYRYGSWYDGWKCCSGGSWRRGGC